MRRLKAVALATAMLVGVSPAWTKANCQYSHVVDPCGKRMVILPAGAADEAHVVALDEGPAASYEPRGVALATVPDWAEFHAFVTQGPYLHVIDYRLYSEDDEGNEIPIEPVRTLSLVDDLGWTPINLTGAAAGDAIVVNGETYYPLYVVGHVPGTIPHPYVMIFDQEALLEGELVLSQVLLGAAYLDYLDDSGGLAIDVVVGATLDDGHKQVAFASVLSGSGIFVQQFHTITVEDGVGFSTAPTQVDPWNDEGLIYDGSEPDAIGLDYESLGLGAYGVFQTSSVGHDLYTGAQTCELGPGDPTDIATWGPDSSLENDYVQFTTASNGAGAGTLLGYAEDVCPYSDPPAITPGALVLPISSRPLALALSSRTSSPFWLYTANGSGGVTAIEVSIFNDPVNGDTIEVLDQFDLDLGGCPSAITFRERLYWECMRLSEDGPSSPRPDDDCEPGDTDPWCLHEFGEKPGGGPD